MLIDTKLVGERLENFAFEFEMTFDSNGNRVFSNVNTGEFFRKAEINVRLKWPTCNVLLFRLHTDKSHVDRTGAIKLWPCYLSIGNFNTKILSCPSSLSLVGYVPMLEISDSTLDIHLNRSGIVTESARKDAKKMLRKYLEQEYLKEVLAPLIDALSQGPLLYQVGLGVNKRMAEFIPIFESFICKTSLNM